MDLLHFDSVTDEKRQKAFATLNNQPFTAAPQVGAALSQPWIVQVYRQTSKLKLD